MQSLANFNTHLTVAAASAGLVSTLCLKVGYVGVADALLMTVAGTTGGILPDIDLKYSQPAKILFSLLGTVTALLWMFGSDSALSILELWLIGVGIYLAIRYPLWMVFHRFAVHRGSIHSVAAAFLAAIVTSAACHQIFDREPFVAWLTGLAMFLGYLVHLILDEVYSVDFMNYRIKRSFGSALKIIDRDHLVGSCTILFCCMIGWLFTPSPVEFFATLSAHETQAMLYQRLVPGWLTEFARGVWVTPPGNRSFDGVLPIDG